MWFVESVNKTVTRNHQNSFRYIRKMKLCLRFDHESPFSIEISLLERRRTMKYKLVMISVCAIMLLDYLNEIIAYRNAMRYEISICYISKC